MRGVVVRFDRNVPVSGDVNGILTKKYFDDMVTLYGQLDRFILSLTDVCADTAVNGPVSANMDGAVISTRAVKNPASPKYLVEQRLITSDNGSVFLRVIANDTFTWGAWLNVGSGAGSGGNGFDRTIELPAASETELGGVKVGSNLEIDGDGVLTAKTIVTDDTLHGIGTANSPLGANVLTKQKLINLLDTAGFPTAFLQQGE
jgi:hypothetical protein